MTRIIKVALKLDTGDIVFKNITVETNKDNMPPALYGYLVNLIQYKDKLFAPCFSIEDTILTIGKTIQCPLYKEVTPTLAFNLED